MKIPFQAVSGRSQNRGENGFRAFKLGVSILFHPLYSMDIIKRERKRYCYLPSALILLAVVLERVAQLFLQNYAVSGMELQDVNFLLDILMILLPVVTYVGVTYYMTGILSGEARLGEIVASSAYAFVPYLILTPILTLASWGMSEGMLPFYRMLEAAVLVWVLVLFFLGLLRLNDYGFWRSVLVALIIVVFMLLVWGLFLLFFALTCQLYMIIKEFLYEITIRNMF